MSVSCFCCLGNTTQVKNPWGPDGFTCAFCERHLRGTAFACYACSWTLCKSCADSQAFSAPYTCNSSTPKVYGAEEEEQYQQRKERQEGLHKLAFGDLSFEEYESQASARGWFGAATSRSIVVDDGEEKDAWANTSEIPYATKTRTQEQDTRSASPHSILNAREQTELWPTASASSCEEKRVPKVDTRGSCGEDMLARGLREFLDVFISYEEQKDPSRITKEECQLAWERLLQARKQEKNTRQEGSDKQELDLVESMIKVTKFKLQVEKERREKVEQELKQTQDQLLKAMQTLASMES